MGNEVKQTKKLNYWIYTQVKPIYDYFSLIRKWVNSSTPFFPKNEFLKRTYFHSEKKLFIVQSHPPKAKTSNNNNSTVIKF